MSVMVPERTAAQRMDALERANEVRMRRAQLKRDIKAGRVDAIDVLCDPPEWAATMRVIDLLLAMPFVGRGKSSYMLNRCWIAPVKTLDGLSERQRGELVGFLRARQ